MTFLFIAIPVICIFVLALLFLFLKTEYYESFSDSGELIFSLDAKYRKVRLFNIEPNKVRNRYIYTGKYNGNWDDLQKLLVNFKNTDGERMFRYALHEISKGTKSFKMSFNYVLKHKNVNNTYGFKVSLAKSEDTGFYIMSILWSLKYKNNFRDLPKPMQAVGLPTISDSFFGAIAFSVGATVKNSRYKIVDIVFRLLKNNFPEMVYVYERNILSFIISDKTLKQTENNLNEMIRILKTKGNPIGFNLLYDASCKVEIGKIISSRDVSRVINVVDYLIFESLQKKIQFISIDKKMHSASFKQFKELSEEFRLSVKSGNISIETNPVQTTKKDVVVKADGNKVVRRKLHLNFVRPAINAIPMSYQNMLVKNRYYFEILQSRFAQKITLDKPLQTKMILDVGFRWIIKHGEEITRISSKDTYFVLTASKEINHATMKAINGLKANFKFRFALRIKSFNENTLALLHSLKPPVIVIDKSISSNSYETNNYIQLLAIKKVTSVKKIVVIFEKPPSKKDSLRDEEIGLSYYY